MFLVHTGRIATFLISGKKYIYFNPIHSFCAIVVDNRCASQIGWKVNTNEATWWCELSGGDVSHWSSALHRFCFLAFGLGQFFITSSNAAFSEQWTFVLSSCEDTFGIVLFWTVITTCLFFRFLNLGKYKALSLASWLHAVELRATCHCKRIVFLRDFLCTVCRLHHGSIRGRITCFLASYWASLCSCCLTLLILCCTLFLPVLTMGAVYFLFEVRTHSSLRSLWFIWR